MKTHLKFSAHQVEEWKRDLSSIHNSILNHTIAIDQSLLLTEANVCQVLGITDRTMRRYRQRHLFHYIKIDKQVYYVKFVFLGDLLSLLQH